jgi:hypothetical protein
VVRRRQCNEIAVKPHPRETLKRCRAREVRASARTLRAAFAEYAKAVIRSVAPNAASDLVSRLRELQSETMNVRHEERRLLAGVIPANKDEFPSIG